MQNTITGFLAAAAAEVPAAKDAATAAATNAAAASQDAPLFGNQWIALGVILVGVAIFTALVALFGRFLAATHPDPESK